MMRQTQVLHSLCQGYIPRKINICTIKYMHELKLCLQLQVKMKL